MKNDIVVSDGDKLKAIRKKYDLKQDEISGNDITRNLISEIETGVANITKKTAEIVIKNLKELGKKKNFKVTETVEYLMENQIVQATKVLDNYTSELQTLVISRDGSFIETLKKAESFLIDWDIRDKKLMIYELAGDYYCTNNEMYKSAVYYEKASALISRMFLDNELLSLSRKLSMVYGYMGNYEKSIECCEFALSRFDDMSLKDTIIFRYNMSFGYLCINNFERALHHIKIAEELSEKNNDTSMHIKILNNKAVCFYKIDKKHEALKVFNQILNLTSVNDLEKRLVILTNIVDVCIDVNKKDEALEKLNIAINQLLNLNINCEHVPDIYFQIGEIYKKLDILELSEQYYLKALDFCEIQKNYVLENNAMCALIDMYTIQNSIEKMKNIKEKAFFVASKRGKIDNEIMYKLMIFYSKMSTEILEIANFSLKFK
ncbi:helix-turn-helix domain-containing protein [Clostridium hydrogenum]|uniref:helix-turn-helix domain-containing protein n=1 Tax=Clostridium hydrogenum TaxID=2855764 RepID=UPI001F4153D8|nr:helix-turn-helix transcriptional regulator [Clostridium hydrogenum]